MSAQSGQRGRRDSSETLAAESPALLDDAPENQGRTLWLAIDFGTTYSTVAFIATYEDSAVPEPGAVKTVRNWKCLGSTKRAAAVPSLVAYRNIGTDRENMLWGFEVDAAIQRQAMRSDESDDVDNSLKGTRMERFKLALSNSRETKDARTNVLEKLRRLKPRRTENGGVLRMKPEDIVAGYLQSLFKNALAEAALTMTDTVKDYPAKCIICIPAIWSQVEECRLRTAAKIAKLPPIQVVSEPEAAFVYWLMQESHTRQPNISQGTTNAARVEGRIEACLASSQC